MIVAYIEYTSPFREGRIGATTQVGLLAFESWRSTVFPNVEVK